MSRKRKAEVIDLTGDSDTDTDEEYQYYEDNYDDGYFIGPEYLYAATINSDLQLMNELGSRTEEYPTLQARIEQKMNNTTLSEEYSEQGYQNKYDFVLNVIYKKRK